MESNYIIPWSRWNDLGTKGIYAFCAALGIYVLPTEELIELLCDLISDEEKAIECFCGLGIIGRELNMPTTDSKLQETDEFINAIGNANRVPIKYPEWVEKFDYKDAIEHYKPDCVLACYATPYARLDKNLERIAKGKKTLGLDGGCDYEWLVTHVKHVIAVSNDDLLCLTDAINKFWCHQRGITLKKYNRPGIYSSTSKKLTVYEWQNSRLSLFKISTLGGTSGLKLDTMILSE